MTEHAHFEELVASHALGTPLDAADAESHSQLMEHLSSCVSCTALYAAMAETAADLALSLDPEPISADFRTSVLKVANDTHAASTRTGWLGRAMLIASLAGMTVLAGTTTYLASQLADLRADRNQATKVVAYLNDPSATVTTMEASNTQGSMTLITQQSGRALLLGTDLSLPPARIFEIWIVRGANLIPAGVFEADNGIAVVELQIKPGKDLGVAITVEESEVAQPTTKPIFQGAIST